MKKEKVITKSRKVRIVTSSYEASHGKSPRGFGGWMFEMTDENNEILQHQVFALYSTAAKSACEHASNVGASIVVVLP